MLIFSSPKPRGSMRGRGAPTDGCRHRAWLLVPTTTKGTLLDFPEQRLLNLINSYHPGLCTSQPPFLVFLFSDFDFPKGRILRSTYNYKCSIGEGKVTSPSGVAIASNGNFIIAEIHADRVHIFDPEYKFIKTFGAGRLSHPYGVALDKNDNIFVSCPSKAVCWDKEGNFLRNIDQTLHSSYDLCLNKEGHLLLAEAGAARISIFKPDGDCIRGIGTKGAADHELGYPTSIRIDGGGNLIIFDSVAQAIKIFDPKGNFIKKVKPDVTPKLMENAFSGDVDEKGNIIVADGPQNELQAFTQEGEILFRFKPARSEEDEEMGTHPVANVTISPEGDLIVSERNKRVSVWV